MQLKSILLFSLMFNVFGVGYGLWKTYKWVEKHQKEAQIELAHYSIQPNKVTYSQKRDELFLSLPNDTNEIIFLGDSHTHYFEWNEIFKNAKNRGISKDITKGILQRLGEVLESKPKKIFIEIGVNDLQRGFSIDSVMFNFTQIIQTVKYQSPETRIYIQNILPTSRKIMNTDIPIINRISILNGRLKDLCLKERIVYIDLYSKFILNGKLNPRYDIGDELHLNSEGYLLWCNLVREYVLE